MYRTMVAAGLAVLCQAAAAHAASFTVNPTQIFLSSSDQVGAPHAEERNGPADPVPGQRRELGPDPGGQMVLEPTEDVVFFPAMLTLGPAEERKIRVGLTVAPAATEKTYRIFVEELPPVDDGKSAPGVTMRTKMGIPIFVQPAKSVSQARLKDLSASADHVSFGLLNAGTVHFTPDGVRSRVSTRRARSSATSGPTRGTCWLAVGAITN